MRIINLTKAIKLFTEIVIKVKYVGQEKFRVSFCTDIAEKEAPRLFATCQLYRFQKNTDTCCYMIEKGTLVQAQKYDEVSSVCKTLIPR
jgi:hypothetical protein